MIKRISFLMKI